MNKKTQKAIAEGRGRTVYYLTPEEADAVDEMRARAWRVKQYEADRTKERAIERCRWCRYLKARGSQVHLYPAKRDGLCGHHWNMIKRCGEDPATYVIAWPNQSE